MTVPVEQLIAGPGDLGCLLVHGLTGTPTEMFPVAEALTGRYPLWVTRVAGHETTPEELASTSWQDWYDSAAAGLDALAATVPRVAVVGLSMGALLAIRLAVARRDTVAGVALLAPAIEVHRGVVRTFGVPLQLLATAESYISPLRSLLARVSFPKGGSDISDLAVRATHPGYRQIPLRAVLNLLALQRAAWHDAPAVTQPSLIIHATNDHACPLAAAERLHARLGSRSKRFVCLDKCFHVITVDCERARVLEEIGDFLTGLSSTAK